MKKRSLIVLAIAAASSAGSTHAALIKDWQGQRGGNYASSGLWTPGGPPKASAAAVARFDVDSAYTVTFSRSRSATRFLVGNDKIVLDLSGNRYVLTTRNIPGVVLGAGVSDIARMTLHDGRMQSDTSSVGHTAGAKANIILSTDAVWKNNGLLSIGSGGIGAMTVIDGAHTRSTDAEVGAGFGACGLVTLSGEGSTWMLDEDLAIGGDDAGSDLIKSLKRRRGKLSRTKDVPTLGKGQVRLLGDAELVVDDLLEIRQGGTLKIKGGSVTAGRVINDGRFGFNAGTFNLTGSDLTLGETGPFGSTLRLNSQQNVNVTRDVSIDAGSKLVLEGGQFSANSLQNAGRIHFDGGTLLGDVLNEASGTLTVKGNATLPGDLLHRGTVRTTPGGTVRFGGDVSGGGSFVGGGTFAFDGLYSPGESPATVSFDGSVEFSSSSKLLLEIMAGGHDQFTVSDSVSLNDVEIQLSAGLIAGETYTLITADQINYGGSIDVSGGSLYGYEVLQGSDTLSLRITTMVVPEPGALVFLTAIPLMMLRRRRR